MSTHSGVKCECVSGRVLFSQVLDLPPNCLQFSRSYEDHFVIGTYFLEEDPDAQPKEPDVEEKLKDLDVNGKQEASESSDEQDASDNRRDTDANSEREDSDQPNENTKACVQKRSGMVILCKLVVKTESDGSSGVEV